MAKWTQAKKYESPKGKILLAATKSKIYLTYRREIILNIIIFLLIFVLYFRS